MEIFKDIKGFEGLYQISNYGNAKTIERIVKRGVKGNMFFKSKPLKNIINNNGYYYITPMKDNIKYTFRIHRLVCEMFLQNPLNKPFVNHIDGNKLNNNLSNLEWCTPSENCQHAWRIGLRKYVKKEKHYNDMEVINLENGIFYDSLINASKSTNLKYHAFFHRLKNINYKYKIISPIK